MVEPIIDEDFSLTTPLLIVTNAGMDAANKASPIGPWVKVKSFAVGDGIGYSEDVDGIRTDVNLRGNLLYSGPITSYAHLEDNTLDLICKIPPDAGPWKFGEIAIFLDDGTMFAKAVFDNWQVKYSSLGSNLALTYTLHCLLRLDQSTAIFQVDTIDGGQTLLSVARWSDVIPPRLSPYPNVQAIIVREFDSNDNSSFLIQSTEARWTVATNFHKFALLDVVNASDIWIETPYQQWVGFYHPEADISDITFLLEMDDHFFRSVAHVEYRIASGVVRFQLNPDPLLNIPVVGARVWAYHNVGPNAGGGLPLCTGSIENISSTRKSLIHTAFVPNLNPAWLVAGRVLAVNLERSVVNDYPDLLIKVNDVDYEIKVPPGNSISPRTFGIDKIHPLLMFQGDQKFLWINQGTGGSVTDGNAAHINNNFNNVTNSGNIFMNGSLQNAPTNITGGWWLFVYVFEIERLIQMAIAHSAPREQYVRTSSNGGNTWSDWVRIYGQWNT